MGLFWGHVSYRKKKESLTGSAILTLIVYIQTDRQETERNTNKDCI